MKKIQENIQEVRHLSQNNTASASTVSATTQEQGAAMEQVAASATSLASMAELLNQLVQGFKL